MKISPFALLLLSLLSSPLLCAQQEEPATPSMEKWQADLTNLPTEERQAFFEHVGKSRRFFNQKRIFETLDSIYQANEIYPNHPAIYNLRGACYVELRDFERAHDSFKRASQLDPSNEGIQFNMGEIEFVTGNWQEAHDIFADLYQHKAARFEQNPDAPLDTLKDLTLFKLFLCKLKLGQRDEALALLEPYDFYDDNLFFYYGHAALEFFDKKEVEGKQWLARGRRVFQNPQALSAWDDTLIEFGYIESFYGKSFDEEGDAPQSPPKLN